MISMTSWKNRLRRMLFLDELEPLVDQTPKVADLGANSANHLTSAIEPVDKRLPC